MNDALFLWDENGTVIQVYKKSILRELLREHIRIGRRWIP